MEELYGLVLAGGFSKRMGRDKGSLMFQGKSLAQRAIDTLRAAGISPVWLSLRPGQALPCPHPKVLRDAYPSCGPMGAIATFFEHFPDKACLVLACDMPLIGIEEVELLVKKRQDPAAVVCFQSPEASRLEPLCAVWESVTYAPITQYIQLQQLSLQRFLQAQPIISLQAPHPERLANLNDPETLARLKNQEQG
ncbi:MAG: molybdenum cofactor guanylyltransferase [Bacteroidota bacterium]